MGNGHHCPGGTAGRADRAVVPGGQGAEGASSIATPFLVLLAVAAVAYFGGRLYKPFHFNKKTHRCEAKGAKQRMACRYYMPGARLGGGCGRHREDGGCRYVQRDLRGLRRF